MLIFMSQDNRITFVNELLMHGNPLNDLIVMALFSLCALNCVMPLIPTIHRSANFKKMGLVSIGVTLLLLILACAVFPYSAEEAPNKLVWRQVYDLNQETSLVTVKTMNSLEKIMDIVPSVKERTCGPDPVSNVLTQCVYEGAIPKIVVDSKKTGEEIIQSHLSVPHYDEETVEGPAGQAPSKRWLRTVHLKWTVKDSRLCQVTFPENSPIVSLKLHGYDDPEEGYQSTSYRKASQVGMVGFKREYDQEWDLKIVYEVRDKLAHSVEGTLGCLYDEWDRGQIPAFTDMRSELPEWALLGGGKGPGLLTIQKKVIV